MKKWMFTLLPLALLISNAAPAQDPPKPGEVKKAERKSRKASMKAVTISGQVSDDGKILVSDDDDIWTVNNPNALAERVGQQVRVKCQVLPEKSEIHVFSVRLELRDVKYVSKSGDSAFRR
jgi:hypothetical protein